MSGIELPADPPGPWNAVAELVELLPADWVLIGGLMVQLHAWEHGVTDVRATIDVDVLGQARPQRALQAIDAALVKAGFQTAPPDMDGYAHRYVRDGLIVDVLAPGRHQAAGDTRRLAEGGRRTRRLAGARTGRNGDRAHR
jgi:hypothetical protein